MRRRIVVTIESSLGSRALAIAVKNRLMDTLETPITVIDVKMLLANTLDDVPHEMEDIE